jgi:NIMA (never in mitosis gene a)-related kinase
VIPSGKSIPHNFQVLKFLGKGSYGSVYLVQRLDDGQYYAVKETDVTKLNTQERQDAANEIRLLASVKHPNIIRYYEAFLDGNWLCIIMEYAQCGDLSHYIKKGKERKTPFPEEIVWSFFIQIARV